MYVYFLDASESSYKTRQSLKNKKPPYISFPQFTNEERIVQVIIQFTHWKTGWTKWSHNHVWLKQQRLS